MIIITEERVRCVCGQFTCENEQKHQKIVEEFQKQRMTRKEIIDFWYEDLTLESENWSKEINALVYWLKNVYGYDTYNRVFKFAQRNLYFPSQYLYNRFGHENFFLNLDRFHNFFAEEMKRIKKNSIELKII